MHSPKNSPHNLSQTKLGYEFQSHVVKKYSAMHTFHLKSSVFAKRHDWFNYSKTVMIWSSVASLIVFLIFQVKKEILGILVFFLIQNENKN